MLNTNSQMDRHHGPQSRMAALFQTGFGICKLKNKVYYILYLFLLHCLLKIEAECYLK